MPSLAPIKTNRYDVLLSLLCCACLILLSYTILNVDPMYVGDDYKYFVPRLLDGVSFFRAQGLSIPWYSPYLCGGFPFFAQPQSLFYSIPQFLSFGVDVWSSIQITVLLFTAIGFTGTYVLSRSVFGWSAIAASAAALSFAGSGFYLSRMAIGHFSYHSFALLPLLLLALLTPLTRGSRAALTAICATYIVQSGGHYLVFFLPIAFVNTTLLILSYKDIPGILRRVVDMLLGTFIALLLCAPKVVASLSFLQEHPRAGAFDQVLNLRAAAELLAYQLFYLGPLTADFDTQKPFAWGEWEYHMTLSPLILIALLASPLLLFRRKLAGKKLIYLWTWLIFTLLTLDLSTGFSPLAEAMSTLPLFEQLRLNMRFTSCVLLSFSLFPLILIHQLPIGRRTPSVLIPVFLLSTLYPAAIQLEQAKGYMSLSRASIQAADSLTRIRTIEELGPQKVDRWSGNDVLSIVNHSTSKQCYQVMFGRAPTKRLQRGGTLTNTAHGLNLINPSCYVFPSENSCIAGELIASEDIASARQFLSYQNPEKWKVSELQRSVSYAPLLGVFLLLFLNFPMWKVRKQA